MGDYSLDYIEKITGNKSVRLSDKSGKGRRSRNALRWSEVSRLPEYQSERKKTKENAPIPSLEKTIIKPTSGSAMAIGDLKPIKTQGLVIGGKEEIPVLNATDIERVLGIGYKMSKEERKAANKTASQYLDDVNQKIRSGEYTDKQLADITLGKNEEYNKMRRLKNKSSAITSFTLGLLDLARPATSKLGDFLNDENYNAQLKSFRQSTADAKSQNAGAYQMGDVTMNAAELLALKGALSEIPALGKMGNAVTGTIAKTLGGGDKATKFAHGAVNVLGDTGLDVITDILPTMATDKEDGLSKEEIQKNALLNFGTSLGGNILGETAPAIIEKLFNNKNAELPKLKETVEQIADPAEDAISPVNQQLQKNLDTLTSEAQRVRSEVADILDIAVEPQKIKILPKTTIKKDSRFSTLDKEVSKLVRWYGDESAIEPLEDFRKALSDFEETGSLEALTRVDNAAAVIESKLKGKTYTYPSTYTKSGALKKKGTTYTYGSAGSVEDFISDELNTIDDIYRSKNANSVVTKGVENPSRMERLPENTNNGKGLLKEESYSANIGKGRVENVSDDVQNTFINDPQMYQVLRNEDTLNRAQEIYDTGKGFEEVYRLLDAKDPASIPLGNKIMGDLIDSGRNDEAVELLRAMSTKLREGGQFTQAAAINMMKSDPDTALRYMVRELDALNQVGEKKYGKKWSALSLSDSEIAIFRTIKKGDTEAIQQAYKQIGDRLSKEYPSKMWEKLVELTKTSMLFNTRTQIRNLVSNAILQPVRSLTDRVSALGQNAIHIINPDVKVTQSLIGGGREEKKLAKEVWESVKSDILDNTSKWNDLKGIERGKQVFKGSPVSKIFDRIFPGAIEKANKAMGKNVDDSLLETVRNFTYYLLEKGDEPFVKNNFVNRLASYMKVQGIKRIEDVPEDAILLATEEAMKATFKDENNFTRALSGVKKHFGKVGEVVLPFTKTPANIAMRGIDYSPAGLVNTFKKAKNGADVSRIMDDLSKNITGSAAIFAGYVLAKNGIIIGSLSNDKDESAFQKQQGKLANSIKVGDSYITYDWAQPAAIPFILGASIYQSQKEWDAEEGTALDIAKSLGNAAFDGAASAINSWAELSPLQSLSDLFGNQYGTGGLAENLTNEILEFPQRLIPAAMGATARTVDPVQRQTYSSGNPVQTLIDTAKSKIPYLSETLPATYDTWGRKVMRNDSAGQAAFAQFINPGQLGNDVSTPLDREIEILYNATGSKDVFPRKTEWKVDGEKLTNRQYSLVQKNQGQLSYKLVDGLIKNSMYDTASDDEKVKIIRDMYTLSKSVAERPYSHNRPSQKNKLERVYDEKGVDAAVQYALLRSRADLDGSGSTSQKEAQAILDSTSLSNVQKAYYFQLFNSGWKSNPYK